MLGVHGRIRYVFPPQASVRCRPSCAVGQQRRVPSTRTPRYVVGGRDRCRVGDQREAGDDDAAAAAVAQALNRTEEGPDCGLFVADESLDAFPAHYRQGATQGADRREDVGAGVTAVHANFFPHAFVNVGGDAAECAVEPTSVNGILVPCLWHSVRARAGSPQALGATCTASPNSAFTDL